MAARSPLRRWKRFFSVFDTIDAAIVAAGSSSGGDEVGCAEELRQAKGAAVQLLCDSPEDDEAEGHCRILDQVMVEYLVTLESVPVSPSALASTGLAAAVGALQDHESDQIRGLARSMVGKWRAAVESDLAEARARVEELRKLSHETLAIKVSPKAIIKQQQQPKRPAKTSTPLLTKKSAPVVGVGRASMATTMDQTPAMMDKKMKATKRKLREGYQEAEDAKRQRKIVLIDPPKMVEQRQRKVHPVTRERSQARCATSAVRRRSWMPSFCRV